MLEKSVECCLLEDLNLCQEDDVNMLCWMVPGIYEQFPNVATNNSRMLHLIISTVDASQLQGLVSHVLLGQLVMFTEDKFLALVRDSLTWETLEQVFTWQLVTAHGVPSSYILPILPELSYSKHPEALTPITLMLKQER
jgi:integrator complex subunit 3